jgi:hypothetical protein
MIDWTDVEASDLACAEDLLDALDPITGRWGNEPEGWCFRGQSCDWPLVPQALRSNVDPKLSLLSNTSLAAAVHGFAEFAAVEKFLRAADRAGLAIPHDGPTVRAADRLYRLVMQPGNAAANGWPPEELFAILALAQHYGVPTRLLDWSFRPLVAAYFAAADLAREAHGFPTHSRKYDPAKRMVVWALNLGSLYLSRGDASVPPLSSEGTRKARTLAQRWGTRDRSPDVPCERSIRSRCTYKLHRGRCSRSRSRCSRRFPDR